MQYIFAVRTSVSLMATPRLFSLKEIAEQCGIPLPDYYISCYYCNRWLTGQEKVLYDHAKLLVVWQDEYPYACCQSCIRICCRSDFLIGFNRSLRHSQFRDLFGDWESQIIRCLTCLRLLNAAEKSEIERNNELLFVVKDSIRAPCCLCKIGL